MGFRGAAQGFQGTARWGFEAQHHGVSRGSNTSVIYHFALSLEVPSDYQNFQVSVVFRPL